MGRSTKSCFKIITCASDSVDRDDLQVSENKSSADKRGWSFRKRSARHRVLSNTVISEVPSSVDKESPEAVSMDYQIQPKPGPPEKTSEMQWTDDEVPQLSAAMDPKVLDSVAVAEVDTKLDIQPDESVVIVIQTAIRKFLAKRGLSKHKNIVMLQAAVRGHLVRRRAVGSLRCVQAIIKMQILVRARLTCLPAQEKRHVKPGKDSSKLKGERKSGATPDVVYTSIEKLLSNSFARRLLESSPNTKSMNMKCDTSRPDLAWEWMERWAKLSPTGIEQSPNIAPSTELKDQEIMEYPENQVETAFAAKEDSESTDFRSITTPAAVPYLNSDSVEAAVPSKTEQNLASQKFEQLQPEFQDFTNSSETPHQPLDKPSDSSPQVELFNLSSKPELEEEQPKQSVERVAVEQSETEGRTIVFGSRKASNAAFIAAQSKFAELTSTSNSVNSVNTCNQENEVEPGEVTVSSSIDNSVITSEANLADDAIPSASRALLGGSECGTELSITSTLDSPEQSEFGAVDRREVNISEEKMSNPKNTATCIENEAGVDNPSIMLNTDLSNRVLIQSEKQSDTEIVDEESSKLEDRLVENASVVQIKSEHETTVNQMYKSSPEASPRSRVTILDSQTTPSSEVSTKSRKTRSGKSGSSQKRKSLSVGKRSPLPSNDSSVRSSLEQLPKDEKPGKRRNSHGSAKTDQVDQEPRDSSSSISIPSYMQATESARAKAYANLSPRSSPDVQDKESYIKKRHSLTTQDRQGSPRIQRSTSLAQQSTKESGNVPTQEKKWQR